MRCLALLCIRILRQRWRNIRDRRQVGTHDELGAFLCESEGNGPAQTRGGACYEGNFVWESRHVC